MNLTQASEVLILDPWWNPAIEDQASDRVHRIGQKQPVTIIRLIANNTIEASILHLHKQKRDIAANILSDNHHPLSLNDLKHLLEYSE